MGAKRHVEFFTGPGAGRWSYLSKLRINGTVCQRLSPNEIVEQRTEPRCTTIAFIPMCKQAHEVTYLYVP